MLTRIVMPQLGESVAEGIVSRWLKQEGDLVAKDEPLVEVVTDKVTAEIPSPVAGILKKIVVAEGATVEVGHELALIEEQVQSVVRVAGSQVASASTTMPEDAMSSAVAHRIPNGTGDAGLPRSSPIVRRLAAEHGIDLAEVSGTGLGGRITREDVLHFLSSRKEQPLAPSQELSAEPSLRATPADREEIVPLSPMRRTIARRMAQSKVTVPHVSTMIEVDMTKVVQFRERMKAEFRRREGVDLTYVPFVIRAVVEALKEHPILNSSWGEDKIIVKKYINIGVAVALEDGLIVPVIPDAGDKSIAGLARAVDDLTKRARAGKLRVADVQGGTFTVNNTGAFGSIMSTPIINQPQAAILSMETIVKRPVVIDDAIAIRSIMNVCLSFDHRITDGLAAGRFLQSVKRRLEGFDPNNLESELAISH